MKKKFAIYFEKILAFLRVRSIAAGLEISDQVIRLVYFNNGVWQMYATRLEPGVLEGGRIKNREAFVRALVGLKEKIAKADMSKKVNVVVCLSSVESFTQVFPLPVIQGGSLDEAVKLNLQMASPLEEGEAYSGWQVVGRDENTVKLEVLAAFIEKKVVDEMVDVLFDAGFLTMALESRALSLTRVLREKGAGVDVTKPYLFVSIDNTGVDFLIVRNGALYFEYGTPWKNLADAKGEVSVENFEAAFAASLKQVMNFYNQHWAEPLAAIILSAVALEAQAEKVIAESAPLPAAKLTLVMGQPVSSEWLVALGCSLRGSGLKAKSQEISLLGEDSQDRFHEEQLLRFMRFWRVLVPVTMGILVLAFVAADMFLIDTKNTIESRSDFTLGNPQSASVAELEEQASAFNRQVAYLTDAENKIDPKSAALATISEIAHANGILVNHLTFQGFQSPISLIGSATTRDSVVAFKAALQANPRFGGVNLPLAGVQASGNTVSFSMTFIFSSALRPGK